MVSVGAGADRILRDGALRRLRTPPVGGASGAQWVEQLQLVSDSTPPPSEVLSGLMLMGSTHD